MSLENVTICYPPHFQHIRFMRQRPQQMCIGLAKRGIKTLFGIQLTDINLRDIYLPYGQYINKSDLAEDNLYVCYDVSRYAREHPDEKIILYASSGRTHIWSDRLRPHALIYDELDNFPILELDAQVACKKADRILYSAKSLAEVLDKRKEKFPEIITTPAYAPNGCEFDYWNRRDPCSLRS